MKSNSSLLYQAFLTFFLMALASNIFAQEAASNNYVDDASGLYAYGGIGPSIPLGKFGAQRAIGFDLNTALEYRYKSGFLIKGMFDFSSFQFAPGTISQESNGTIYKLGGANNLVSLLGAGGYYFQAGRLAPYGFAGLGASFVSIPKIDVDKVNNIIDTNLSVQGYFSTITGLGADFILRRSKIISDTKKRAAITLYLETFYTYIPSRTETSIYKFNLLSANIGLKSKF